MVREEGNTPSSITVVASDRGSRAVHAADPGRECRFGLPYELRIGVAGHRDIADPSALHLTVKVLLQQIVQSFGEASRHPRGPHGSEHGPRKWIDDGLTSLLAAGTRVLSAVSAPRRWLFPSQVGMLPIIHRGNLRPNTEQQTPLKLTVVSSLAQGSDQIVTTVVHELVNSPSDPVLVAIEHRNRYVEAVLPLPIAAYERTFTSPDELQSFRELLLLDRGRWSQRPQPTIVCPEFPLGNAGNRMEPADAYRLAGRHVVDSVELLIAIWDPEREELPGGTGETVRYALQSDKLVIWINPSRLEDRPRLLRWTQGATKSTSPGSAPSGLSAVPLSSRAKDLSPNFHKLAAYNRDRAVDAGEIEVALVSAIEAFDSQSRDALPEPVRETMRKRVLPHVVRADLLSLRYRALRDAAAKTWPALAAFAVSLMAFQILFLPNAHWLAWIELGLLLFCGVSYRVSLTEAWHDKWRNDRRLAEALRTAMFTALVTTDTSTDPSQRSWSGAAAGHMQHPLPYYDAEQSWFVGALKRIVAGEQRRFAAAIDWNRDLRGIASFLGDAWLREQAEYHEGNAHRHHAKAKRNAIARLGMIGLIMLVAVLHALGLGHDAQDHHHGSSFARLDLWIGWATIALPAWAAALHALTSSEDHERLAARSSRMAPMLTALARRMHESQGRDELADCVRQAEWLLDLENQEWAESLSERKPEFTG